MNISAYFDFISSYTMDNSYSLSKICKQKAGYMFNILPCSWYDTFINPVRKNEYVN